MHNTINYPILFDQCLSLFSAKWLIKPSTHSALTTYQYENLIGYINPLYPPLISIITQLNEYSLLGPEQTCLGILVNQSVEEFSLPSSTSSIPLIYIKETNPQQVLARLTSFVHKIIPCHHIEQGVMMDCFGKGILIVDPSGIGKSEAALNLLARGHRLISDDIVYCYKNSLNQIMAYSDPKIKHLLEIRGMGLINVKDWYGPLCTLNEKSIDLIVSLLPTTTDPRPLEKELVNKIILGVSLAKMNVPLAFKRDLAMLIESAVKFAFSPVSTEIKSLLYPA